MSNACWNCIFGQETRNEEPYNIHPKSETHQAPRWPEPLHKNEKMYILPKLLSTDDTIIITGKTFEQRERLSINLITGDECVDRSNVACQLDMHFHDLVKIAIQVVKDGNPEPVNDKKEPTISFLRSEDPLSFQVKFKVRSEQVLDIYVGPYEDIQKVESVKLKHDLKDIRFLTLHGDIHKVVRLDFNFA